MPLFDNFRHCESNLDRLVPGNPINQYEDEILVNWGAVRDMIL